MYSFPTDNPAFVRAHIARIRAGVDNDVRYAISKGPAASMRRALLLPYLRHLLTGSMGFASVFLLAMLASPTQSSTLVAMRNPPLYTCVGRDCTLASSSSSTGLFFTNTKSVSSLSTHSASSALPAKGFLRLHAAPPDEFAKPDFLRADNVQGVYMTASSIKRQDFLDQTIADLKASGGNAMVMDVKGGKVFFDTSAPMAKELNLVVKMYDLPTILDRLHQEGIYSIGRFVAIKDYGFTQARPDTLPKSPKTGHSLGTEWVDPSNPDALEYNRQIICDLASAGIDEINMDYIRFSTANFGELRVWTGQEKADKVEVFIKMARDAVDSCGHGKTRLGISTYAILGWDYDVNVETLGQDVKRFAPLVDIISPMAYPASFKSDGYYVPGRNTGSRDYWLTYRTLTGYADLLGPDQKDKVRPWIEGYSVTANDMRDEIKAVYDAGFCGFQVWSAGNNYGPTYGAMKNPPAKPERCL